MAIAFPFPKSLSEAREKIAEQTYTLPELVEAYLANIQARSSLNAMIEVYDDEAKAQAKVVAEKMQLGNAGKLAGMVIAIKDNLAYKGHKVSAASKILDGFESIYTATAVQRLLNEDAIIIGRANCDEFAMGSSNETSFFGPTKNPLDESLVPGGSSGGSAAAVAANLCLAALGSDTGGSIRQPASFCGLVGLKPTYGRVSRFGLLAYASSFDQIGPFTRTIADAELLLDVMSGQDDYDSTLPTESKYNVASKNEQVKTIAYPKQCLEHESLDPEVRAYFEGLIDDLHNAGYAMKPYDFKLLDYLVPTYYVLCNAEASSNLSRYDGIHYGYRSAEAKDLNETYTLSRTEGFGAEVKRRIMLGTFVLSAGYYDAYYERAQKVRQRLRNETLEVLTNADLILMPTSPHTAFKVGGIKDPIKMYLEDIFTVQANLCGFPAISIPAATHSNGLPFGVQLMAAPFQEAKLFDLAQSFFNK